MSTLLTNENPTLDTTKLQEKMATNRTPVKRYGERNVKAHFSSAADDSTIDS